LAGIQISASEPAEQSPSLFLESGAGGIGCRGWTWGVIRKWAPGAIGSGAFIRSVTGGSVSVKTVPSKATLPRQPVSGADRFISAVFQAASFRGGSPWRYAVAIFPLAIAERRFVRIFRSVCVAVLMISSSVAHADLPLTVEDLITDKGKIKVDMSLSYANSDRQGVSTGEPIDVQTGIRGI